MITIIGAITFLSEEIAVHELYQEKQRGSSDQLEIILGGIADGVTAQDPTGRVIYANEAAAKMVGYLSGEQLMKAKAPWHEVLGRFEVLDEEGRPFPLENLPGRRALGGEELAEEILRFRDLARGEERWCVVKAVPVFDEQGEVRLAVNIFREITEHRRMEEALRQSEELYRSVIEQAAENIFLVDVQTKRILDANAALHRSLGYAPEELEDKSLYEIVAHEKQSVDQNIERILEEGHHFLKERRYRRKDGSIMDVEVSVSVVSHGGREAMCVVAHDVTERKQTEKDLRRSLDTLLAIYEAGQILGTTLEVEEIGSRLLQLMQRLSSAEAAVISVPDDRRQLRVWRAVGLENLWRRARFTPEVQASLGAVMKKGEHMFSRLRPPEPNAESLTALFLPLKIRNHTIGVLEVYGSEAVADRDVLDSLLNLTTKAASALENARLYGQLAERERQLQEVVGRLLFTQEEERRRIAYEVHDGPTQMAVGAYQHLQAFASIYPPDTAEGRQALDEVVELIQRTIKETREVIAKLRPAVLDEFGLATALRLQVEALRTKGWQISCEENLNNACIPSPVEITLYRVAQEALANVLKHARATHIRLRLSRSTKGVRLLVRDWGVGFRPDSSQTCGPGERVGLAGMRERVALVGGKLSIYSKEGTGSLVMADIPLLGGAAPQDFDLVFRLAFTGHRSAADSDA
jgi:PAS domain S-box-containing protein